MTVRSQTDNRQWNADRIILTVVEVLIITAMLIPATNIIRKADKMIIAVVHGYLLRGTGSNLYVSNLCRSFCNNGHNVLLFSQDSSPEEFDFISSSEIFREGNQSTLLQLERNTNFPGKCTHFRPNLGGLLPVYVFDNYPGHTVKEFTDMSESELEGYLEKNCKALKTVFEQNLPDLIISQHTIMQPVYTTRAIKNFHKCRHIVTVHGSALNFSVRKSLLLRQYALEGITSAKDFVFVSRHSQEDFQNYFHDVPNLSGRCRTIPAGVNIELFQPLQEFENKQEQIGQLVIELQNTIKKNGTGRTALEQQFFRDNLQTAEDTLTIRNLISKYRASSDNWAPDQNAAEKIANIDWENVNIVLYFGKYLWTKGIHLLIAAAPLILKKHPRTHFIIVGFGAAREYLETMVALLNEGRLELLTDILRNPLRYDQEGSGKPSFLGSLLTLLSDPDNALPYIEAARGTIGKKITFTGIMDHEQLRKLIPCSDITVAPSIFPESFGLVAVETLACGVLPIQTYHSGFADVIDVYEEAFRDVFDSAGLKHLTLNENLVSLLATDINNLIHFIEQLNGQEKQVLRNRAHLLAAKNYSWEMIASQYLHN